MTPITSCDILRAYSWRSSWRRRRTIVGVWSVSSTHRSEILTAAPETRLSAVHRDFYPAQILVRGESGWLLDLDLYSMGDPALDLGNFVAHLQERSQRMHGHCHGYAHLERSFLEGYAAASGRPLSLSIAAWVTVSLSRAWSLSAGNFRTGSTRPTL